MERRFCPDTICLLYAAHDAAAEVANLAAAMRSVVKVGVIRAFPVLHEGSKEQLARLYILLLCPSKTEIVTFRVGIGAGLGTHRTLTHRCPDMVAVHLAIHLIAGGFLPRRGYPGARQKVGTAIDEVCRRRARLCERLVLFVHGDLEHLCDQLIRAAVGQ